MISEERLRELWFDHAGSPESYDDDVGDFARAVAREARREERERVMACIGGCECPCCLAIRALYSRSSSSG